MSSEPRVPTALLSYRKRREKRELDYQHRTKRGSSLQDVIAAWAVAISFLFGMMAWSVF